MNEKEWEKEEREKFDKYWAWVLASGLHGMHLAKPAADYWLAILLSQRQEMIKVACKACQSKMQCINENK